MKRIAFASCWVLVAVCGCRETRVSKGPTVTQNTVAAEDGSVILALEEDPMPVGAVLESDSTMEMEEAKLTFILPDREMEGGMMNKETSKSRSEGLAQNKVRRTLLMKEKTEQMAMGGKTQPPKTSSDPMVGIPVIAEKGADGKWNARLESGEPTPEITKELEKISRKMAENSDKRIYGTVPRKVGDEWVSSGDDLMGMDDTKGTFKVKLEAVEDYKGERCAKMTGTMEMAGTMPSEKSRPPMKMRMSGSFKVYRSIEHRVDLSNELTGKMEINGELEPQPGMTMKMKMEGAMKMTVSAKVTLAK